MPVYNYHCAANGRSVEVTHAMTEDLSTWGQVRERAQLEDDGTPDDTPVERLLYSPNINTPLSNTHLKEQGFTKLVRRDKGVYENVTAIEGEKRYVRADAPGSMTHFDKKVGS